MQSIDFSEWIVIKVQNELVIFKEPTVFGEEGSEQLHRMDPVGIWTHDHAHSKRAL